MIEDPQKPKGDIKPGEDPHVSDQAERHEISSKNLKDSLAARQRGETYNEGETLPDVNPEPQISEEEATRRSRIEMLTYLIKRRDSNFIYNNESIEELEALKAQLDQGHQ